MGNRRQNFYEIIDVGDAAGMQTFDKSIIKGFRDGLITEQTALAYASQRSIVRRRIDEFNYAIGIRWTIPAAHW